MRILIIEDDPNKLKQIILFVNENYPDIEIESSKSYQSGLKSIFLNKYDLILLDMSLPTYDISSGEDGYRFRKLAGQEILSELKRRKKNEKIIIVTQFETFGEGDNYIELKDLRKKMKLEFSDNYIGTVYYNPAQSEWKSKLKYIIDNKKEEE